MAGASCPSGTKKPSKNAMVKSALLAKMRGGQ